MRADYVYFIQRGDDGPIKVGYSSNPASRLVSLQGGHYDRLHLIGLTEGGRWEEEKIHTALRPWELGREWYSPVPEVFSFIEEAVPPVAAALDAVLEAKERIRRAVQFLREAQHDIARDELVVARRHLDEALDGLPVAEDAA